MTENVKPPHFRSFHKCQILAVISTPRENVDFLLIRNNGQKLDLSDCMMSVPTLFLVRSVMKVLEEIIVKVCQRKEEIDIGEIFVVSSPDFELPRHQVDVHGSKAANDYQVKSSRFISLSPYNKH